MLRILSILCLSIFALPAIAVSPSPFFAVADDYIHPHLIEQHEEALREFKLRADRHEYEGSWRFYHFDDGRHIAFSGNDSSDFDSAWNAQWEKVAEKFDANFLAENGEVYTKTIAKQNFFQIRYLPHYSHINNDNQNDAMETMVWIELQLKREYDRDAFKQWVAEQKEKHPTQYFAVFSKLYGSNTPTTYIALEVKSATDYYKNLAKQGTHDWVTLLPEAFKKGIAQYDISIATYLPDISY